MLASNSPSYVGPPKRIGGQGFGLVTRTGLNSVVVTHSTRSTIAPPSRRPLMPLNNWQPQDGGLQHGGKLLGMGPVKTRSAWADEVTEVTTPIGKGTAAVLPTLHGSNITVDSPDVTSKFFVDSVKNSNLVNNTATFTSSGMESPADVSSSHHNDSIEFSPCTESSPLPGNGMDMMTASLATYDDRHLSTEFSTFLMPRPGGQAFLPVMSGSDVFIHSPDPVSKFNVHAVSGMEKTMIGRGVANIRATLGDGEGIASSASRNDSLTLTRSDNSLQLQVLRNRHGPTMGVAPSSGIDDEKDDVASPIEANAIGATTRRQLHGHLGNAAGMFSPLSDALDSNRDHDCLDKTISPLKPDYESNVMKIRTLQSIAGTDCEFGVGSSSSTVGTNRSVVEHLLEGRKQKTRGPKPSPLIRSSSGGCSTGTGTGTGIGTGTGGGGGSRLVEHTTSSIGVVSTFFADGSPTPVADPQRESIQGKLLYPMAPPLAPSAQSFYRSTDSGPGSGNDTSGNNLTAISTGAAFVKRGRVYRSLGAKEAFAFGSPPSTAKVIHLKRYSDTSATIAAANGSADERDDADDAPEVRRRPSRPPRHPSAPSQPPSQPPSQQSSQPSLHPSTQPLSQAPAHPSQAPHAQPAVAESKRATDRRHTTPHGKGFDERKKSHNNRDHDHNHDHDHHNRLDDEDDDMSATSRECFARTDTRFDALEGAEDGCGTEGDEGQSPVGPWLHRQGKDEKYEDHEKDQQSPDSRSTGVFYRTARDLMFSPPSHSSNAAGSKGPYTLYSPPGVSSPSPVTGPGTGSKGTPEETKRTALSPLRIRRHAYRPSPDSSSSHGSSSGDRDDSDALLATLIGGPELSPVAASRGSRSAIRSLKKVRRGAALSGGGVESPGGQEGGRGGGIGVGGRKRSPVIRISKVSVSSNFGTVKSRNPPPRKRRKNSVNPFVANGPSLASIPEDEELP